MLNRDEIQVEVCGLQPFENEKFRGFSLIWAGNIGFGEYTIYQPANDQSVWFAESEHMDSKDDKWFLKKLMNDFIEKIEVKE